MPHRQSEESIDARSCGKDCLPQTPAATVSTTLSRASNVAPEPVESLTLRTGVGVGGTCRITGQPSCVEVFNDQPGHLGVGRVTSENLVFQSTHVSGQTEQIRLHSRRL